MDKILNHIKSVIKMILPRSQTCHTRTEVPPVTLADLKEVYSFFPMKKFFIFGHARSGTTLLARLIRLHPEVHCNWQAHFFTNKPLLQDLVASREIEAWLSHRSNRWNRGQDLSPLMLRAAADFIMERDALRNGKKIVGDKSPNSLRNGQAVRDMHTIYPDAYLIYIVRDGRDVAISQRFRNFVEEASSLTEEDKNIARELADNPDLFYTGQRSIFTDTWLQRAAKRWVRNLDETDKEGRRLYGERYLSLRYEDLLAHPFLEMKRVWSFLGVGVGEDMAEKIQEEMNANPDQVWQKQRNAKIASFLPKGKVGNWQQIFTSQDRIIYQRIAGEMLRRWEYEVEEYPQ